MVVAIAASDFVLFLLIGFTVPFNDVVNFDFVAAFVFEVVAADDFAAAASVVSAAAVAAVYGCPFCFIGC
jgi:hypothetical protein